MTYSREVREVPGTSGRVLVTPQERQTTLETWRGRTITVLDLSNRRNLLNMIILNGDATQLDLADRAFLIFIESRRYSNVTEALLAFELAIQADCNRSGFQYAFTQIISSSSRGSSNRGISGSANDLHALYVAAARDSNGRVGVSASSSVPAIPLISVNVTSTDRNGASARNVANDLHARNASAARDFNGRVGVSARGVPSRNLERR